MARLSDRAFQIVKNEIERRYSDDPEDQIERVILLSRLETMKAVKGKPMTRIQIWEVLSDIAPNFDQNVLMDAESVETDSPILGASIGVGAVAMLISAAIGMEYLTGTPVAETPDQSAPVEQSTEPSTGGGAVEASTASDAAARGVVAEPSSRQAPTFSKKKIDPEQHSAPGTEQRTEKQAGGLPQLLSFFSTSSEKLNAQRSSSSNAAELDLQQSSQQPFKPASRAEKVEASAKSPLNSNRIDYFETARSLGWQAALKSQNPPHDYQHWRETATLWQLAISHLDQVPPDDAQYMRAQLKKTLYRENLQQIKAQQASVLSRGGKTQTPQFSATVPQDALKVAKQYGWQAAVASQNAPHPLEKWADISRLWQTALLNLNKIDAANPSYAEAQQVKARYQKNLSDIRDRYQTEQAATQRLQSLQASLAELNNAVTPKTTQYSQLESIVAKLQTIPQGTNAHSRAQQLISEAVGQMSAIAANTTN